jgi:hypothetical protein
MWSQVYQDRMFLGSQPHRRNLEKIPWVSASPPSCEYQAFKNYIYFILMA